MAGPFESHKLTQVLGLSFAMLETSTEGMIFTFENTRDVEIPGDKQSGHVRCDEAHAGEVCS